MKKTMGYVSLLVLTAAPALAQERYRTGLDFLVGGSTSAVGATWHVTDRFALRPLLSYAWDRYVWSSSASPEGVRVDKYQRTTSLGAGLGALLYLRQRESLSTYVTAGFELDHVSQRPDEAEPSWTGNGGKASGAFGVQYAFTKHVSAFGETGLAYTMRPASPDGSLSKHLGTLQTGVGAIFYLD
jgi:hypothetical protein